MNAFQRFISRRGKPKRIISDNAPSFILADKTIDFLIKEPHDSLAKKGIDWTFIPAYSPWAGGTYERLIGITKQLFQRTLGKEILHFDDLITFTAKAEATINSRPISTVSEEKDGFLPLRPADLLIPKIELSLPTDRLLEEIPFRPDSHENLAEIYIATDRAHEFFWERWSREYLLMLRTRTQTAHKGKRLENHSDPKIGEIVIVEEKYCPKNLWPMGRIAKLGGKPGAIRSVELKMQNGGTVTRPVNSICPLEIGTTEKEVKTPDTPNLPAPETIPETPTQEPHPTNQGHRMLTRSKARALVSTLLSIAIFIFCLITVHGSSINNTTCQSCQILCTKGGVTVISPSEFSNLELCCAGNCLIKPHSPKIDYELPHEILVIDYHCQITLTDTQNKIYHKEKTCPAQDECSLIDCTVCWDRITNPTCAPVNSGMLIGSGILLILIFLSWIITHVKIVFTAFHFIFSIFFVLFQTPLRALRAYELSLRHRNEGEEYLLPEYTTRRRSHRERDRRWRINRLYRNGLMTLLACIFLSTAHASNEIIAVTAKNSDCRRTQNGTQCTIKSAISLTILPANQRTSILVRNERGLALGTFSITLERLTLNCLSKSVAWLRSYRVLTASAKRCARAGLCFGNHCQTVRPHTNIPELGEANFFPGNTFCMDSPGFWGSGCGLPADGCLYYRFYAKPASDAAYELVDCPSWQFKIKVRLQIETGTNVESTDTILHPGQTKKWETQIGPIAFSTNPTALPPLPILSRRFVLSSYSSAAITGSIPLDLFCTDEDAARSFNCSLYRETCHDCYPDHDTGKVECFCRDLDMESILSDSSHRLPLSLPNFQIMNFQNEIFAETEYTPIHTLVQFENVELALETEDSHCFITVDSLVGCYRCLTGAQAKFTCSTDYGSALASVKCLGTHLFSARCTENGTAQSAILAFNWAQIDVDCRVECPAGFSQFNLKGELKYIPRRHQFHYAARLNENRTPNGEFNTGLDWTLPFSFLFGFPQILIIFTIIIVGIFALIIFIKFNPIFRAYRLLLSILTFSLIVNALNLQLFIIVDCSKMSEKKANIPNNSSDQTTKITVSPKSTTPPIPKDLAEMVKLLVQQQTTSTNTTTSTPIVEEPPLTPREAEWAAVREKLKEFSPSQRMAYQAVLSAAQSQNLTTAIPVEGLNKSQYIGPHESLKLNEELSLLPLHQQREVEGLFKIGQKCVSAAYYLLKNYKDQLPNTLMNEAAKEIRQAMNKIEPSSSAFASAAQLSIRDRSRSRSPVRQPYRPPHRSNREGTYNGGSRSNWHSDGRHSRR